MATPAESETVAVDPGVASGAHEAVQKDRRATERRRRVARAAAGGVELLVWLMGSLPLNCLGIREKS